MFRRPWFHRETHPPTPGYGKRFAFHTDGETSFLNFTAPEIIQILTSMRGVDAMTSSFEDGS